MTALIAIQSAPRPGRIAESSTANKSRNPDVMYSACYGKSEVEQLGDAN
jgi:hypothetical protein